jgi:hypothetical protein
MRKILLPCLFFSFLSSCADNKKVDAPGDTMVKTAATSNKTTQVELADAKYTEIGKQMMQQMEAGNMDAWAGNFADNAVYSWSGGDSLAGKKAIMDYWTNRRKNVIQSIHFAQDIWIPMKVNTPQRGPDMPGIWLLNWYQVSPTYKNGKALQFWVHTDYHFDNNNKVDRAIQYIDMAPIKEALSAR